MEHFTSVVSLIFLLKTFIWNKMTFRALYLLNFVELVENEFIKSISIKIYEYFFFYPIYLKFTLFHYKQCYFSTQPQCCLTFSRIEFQMLLKRSSSYQDTFYIYCIGANVQTQAYLCLIYVIYFLSYLLLEIYFFFFLFFRVCTIIFR